MSDEKKPPTSEARTLVWSGRPSVSPYIAIYGIILMVILIVLVTVEFLLGSSGGSPATFLPTSLTLGGFRILYPIELATAVIIILIFLGELLSLALLRARSKYELYDDGLYVNLGIINLENTFLSPMAFSDARLFRSWTMRLVHRGLIIVDANDGRHFYLRLIKDPLQVQSLIRTTLSRPRVRMD